MKRQMGNAEKRFLHLQLPIILKTWQMRHLTILESFKTKNTELQLNIADLKAMSYLSLYNAYKNRAAIFLRQDKKLEARENIAKAYCYWRKYTNLMDSLYIPVDTQRNWDFGDSRLARYG